MYQSPHQIAALSSDTVSGCIRKELWSFFTSPVSAFIMAILSLVCGLQASETHGVQYFGDFLLRHKEKSVLLTHILGEYLLNTWKIA